MQISNNFHVFYRVFMSGKNYFSQRRNFQIGNKKHFTAVKIHVIQIQISL